MHIEQENNKEVNRLTKDATKNRGGLLETNVTRRYMYIPLISESHVSKIS